MYIYIYIYYETYLYTIASRQDSQSHQLPVLDLLQIAPKKTEIHINSKNCARTDSCSGASPSFPAFPGKSQGSEDFTSEGHGKKPGWIIKIGETAGQKITLGIPRKIPVVSISFDLLKKIKEGAGTLEEMFDDFRTKIKGGS